MEENSPQSSAHGFVVHVGLVFVQTPQTGNGLRVDQLEDACKFPRLEEESKGLGCAIVEFQGNKFVSKRKEKPDLPFSLLVHLM